MAYAVRTIGSTYGDAYSVGVNITNVRQNIAGNYTTVYVELYTTPLSHGGQSFSSGGGMRFVVGGSVKLNYGGYDWRIGSKKTLWSGDVRIDHNSSTGKGSLPLSWAFDDDGTSLYSNSASDTYYPPDIPRASTISVDKNTVIANGYSQIVATITRKNSSFTNKLELSCGTRTKEIPLSQSGETFTGIVRAEPYWIQEFAPALSGTAKLKVTTYNGSSVIGSNEVNITITQNNKSSKRYGLVI